ncbi:MAG TPA: hypothetical protein DFR83_15655 [Deltaproteobacteria bacterium]|nr:hypothetical protein [Deltaproteobacteria bacterium]
MAVASGVNESEITGDSPRDVARNRAGAKALAVARQFPDALVIGADQVVHLDDEPIGKPRSAADWMQRLRAFRGRTHLLTTAVALVGGGVPEEHFSVDSRVRFRADVSDEELAAYIAHGEAQGCAGGYMVEQRGVWLIEAIDGDWTNVVGMPIFHLVGRLRCRGFRLHADGLGRVAGVQTTGGSSSA